MNKLNIAQNKISFSDNAEATDIALFARNNTEKVDHWDKEQIKNILISSAMLDNNTAIHIATEIENIITSANIKIVTTSLIHELINYKLVERGLDKKHLNYSNLRIPLYNIDNMLRLPNKENANVPHGPEATNLTLAEFIKKEYALINVFSHKVANAHMRGDIHLHDLGFIDRPYCSGQNLEYIKKFGLNLPNSLALAKPAKHAEVLLAHMVKFAAALQSNFAGAIGWDAVNLFFAPYLEHLSGRAIKQIAQMLIFEFSQQAVARGGQAIFTDINLYWEVPKHFESVPAIGPNGKYTGKTYSEYEKTAQLFAWKLFEVYMEGDGAGRPFFFPKPLVHITEKFFKTKGYADFLYHISNVASLMGNTYFIFDRGETAKISECCRLSFKLEENDIKDAKTPWKMRYSALQNITLNLPRIAYEAKRDEKLLYFILQERIKLAIKAHLQKYSFIQELLNYGSTGPLALLTMNLDGQSYLRIRRSTYLIGMVGLNEMVKQHLGKELHDSKEAIHFGLKIIAKMKLLCDHYSTYHKMRFVLEQTPAESTAHRFAKLDLKHFPKHAYSTVKGDLSRGEVYYTNSTLFNISASINSIERVKLEGCFHPIIEAGAITHIWLGEQQPSKESIANFIIKVFYKTKNDQIAFSPEFSYCRNCGRNKRGLHEKCLSCNSKNIEQITRITGYFTRISSWNKGKIGELKDRYRNPNLTKTSLTIT